MTTSDATIVAVGASREGGGELTAAEHECGSCGAHSPSAGPFCSRCGARLAPATHTSEYKQVTVLFADVVRSMDIAATVDIERLRDVMTAVVERSAAVVQRYGGTVDYNGDGVMAVFGAPKALEDHAFRACASALAIQDAMAELASEVQRRDGVTLQVRVGLNSGRVIAGDLGSGMLGYAATGSPVGVAQRIESAAPAGGVMLSESTARLVEHTASLGELEWVSIKGSDQPVRAYRLVGIKPRDGLRARAEARLVGRSWEMAALDAVVDRAIDGHGSVVEVVGPPGIGKSRTAREIAASAAARGVDVFWAFCESHASDIPFHAAASLLRATTGIGKVGGATARARVRARFRDADREDLLLLDDLLGVADPDVALPLIDPDARRRRLISLIRRESLARTRPALVIIEDAHWIDTVSESLIFDFVSVIPHTPLTVLICYRPEYRGALARLHRAERITLGPLRDPDMATLLGELLGRDRSVIELGTVITERAAGNPFFAEEMVRELAQRGVLHGDNGDYVSNTKAAEVVVPDTIQAVIEARIDRLGHHAKRTLNAASVIGARFSTRLLSAVGVQPAVDELVSVELVDKVGSDIDAEYVFRHPLILAVAYQSQLKSDRAEWHLRLATAIQTREPGSVEENSALIAEHLEAAGDQHAAYGWHMRAAGWSTHRDITAARVSWDRARRIADGLPDDDPARRAMRTAPRTLLCASSWRITQEAESAQFDELRELCAEGHDQASLAIAMTGLVTDSMFHGRARVASQQASEQMALLESVGNPTLTIAAAYIAIAIKGDTGEMSEVLRWSQYVVDVADGDPHRGASFGMGSPLAAALVWRGIARYWLGQHGWRGDLDDAVAMARGVNPATHALIVAYRTFLGVHNGVLHADRTAVRQIEEALSAAEVLSGDTAVGLIKAALAGVLLAGDDLRDRTRGLELVAEIRRILSTGRSRVYLLPIADVYAARETARRGECDGALTVMRQAVNDMYEAGRFGYGTPLLGLFIETLVGRGGSGDLAEAEKAIERMTRLPAEDGLVLRDVWLLKLRTLLALARGDRTTHSQLAARYFATAESLGFEGHIAWAKALIT